VFNETIKNLNIRCFKVFPDHELYEIGSECAATLMKLDDLITKISKDEIVYLISDDITADLELERWSKERSQSIIDMRKEGDFFHFLIRKENDI
jgi:TusA-related sulfurtransferase